MRLVSFVRMGRHVAHSRGRDEGFIYIFDRRKYEFVRDVTTYEVREWLSFCFGYMKYYVEGR